MNLGIVVLAAGQGTRMKSDLPKVLHPLAGRPLLRHALNTARSLDPARIAVVYGHGGEAVPQAIGDDDLIWVEQAQRLGTGHAVAQAMPAMAGMDQVLILYGDVPLIRPDTLRELLAAQLGQGLALLTAVLADPAGYGRIVRDRDGRVLRIVEQKDASPGEIELCEINTGFLVADRALLEGWLGRIGNRNAQGEYYLTDIVGLATDDGLTIATAGTTDLDEVLGVNDRLQLAHLERRFQRRQADELMRRGVTLLDPDRFDLRGALAVGRDVEIDCNVIFEGSVSLGDGVRIGANSVIRNARIGAHTLIKEHCVIEQAEIGPGNRIGPFARIRPETTTAADVHIGNFVEIKKSDIGQGSKVNHLSYVGDTTMGSGVNIGAGAITCNYDGANKHRTEIGDRAFIGSDTQLIAPVRVGAGATIGAGSTITRDTPAEKLTLSRAKQITMEGWRRPVKRPKE